MTAKREITTFDAVERTEGAPAAIVAADGHRHATSAASATIPHWLRGSLRFLPALGTAVGVAALLKLVYAPWFLNYDARYALVWARDLANGPTSRMV